MRACLSRRSAPARRTRQPPSRRQAKYRLARALKQLEVRRNLEPFHPRIATTLGTGLETPRSDIDIICAAHDPRYLLARVTERYGSYRNFRASAPIFPCVVNFSLGQRLEVEIYTVSEPTSSQPAVLHARAHSRLLRRGGSALARDVRHLKLLGLSTEEAFASVLDLRGDPYLHLYYLGECAQRQFDRRLRSLHLETLRATRRSRR